MNKHEMIYGKNMASIIELVEEGRKQQLNPLKIGIFVCLVLCLWTLMAHNLYLPLPVLRSTLFGKRKS